MMMMMVMTMVGMVRMLLMIYQKGRGELSWNFGDRRKRLQIRNSWLPRENTVAAWPLESAFLKTFPSKRKHFCSCLSVVKFWMFGL